MGTLTCTNHVQGGPMHGRIGSAANRPDEDTPRWKLSAMLSLDSRHITALRVWNSRLPHAIHDFKAHACSQP